MKEVASNWKTRTVDTLAILLVIAFLGAAISKLVTFPATVEQFGRFGYAWWMVPVTVVVELVAAALTAFKATRYWGASLMVVTMIAAMLSHLKADEPAEMIPPLILMIMASGITWIAPPTENLHRAQKTANS